MQADIKLYGPVKYGLSSYELQAEIVCADTTVRTVKWSTHFHKEDAEKYRDSFNAWQQP